ncbi:hypothetical protein F511_41633 [Dorcoceras hygrometricum]|uniref:Uncharacterized protein n=1 Tax=Dorcoceras hygrometricum TaxID=472368 RepID=A0A2Z7B6U8_9LAMI|nr:hypothetical protein F511_41633 [Dorcoceras hygrometricum]
MSASRKIPTVHDDWIVALDSLRLALPIYTSLEARSSELRNPEGPARSCVVHQSNAIIGAVTTGYECLPPSCDGLTGPDDHGPMISRLIDRDCGRNRQSGPRPETRLLHQPVLEGLTRSARTDSPRRIGQKRFSGEATAAAHGGSGGGL